MTQAADKQMTRRDALQLSLMALGMGLGATACSTVSAPAQKAAAGAVEKIARGTFFSAEEMTQLAEIAEIIIPTTDTVGARGANVHGFIDRMMVEGAVSGTQTLLRAALHEVDSNARQRFGASFTELPPGQRFEVLAAIDAAAFKQEGDLGKGDESEGKRIPPFARLKELVFLGYYQSEIGATQELQFQLVPGRYEGCVPLSQIGRAWAEEWSS